jgi:hypothetical protein
MHCAYWLRKDTGTHSEYVIFIPFPLQQWLHERPSMLRYTYSACLVDIEGDQDKGSEGDDLCL